MRVLVTGGSGFLGEHVIRALLERGHEAVAVVRSARASDIVSVLGATPVNGDLDEPESVDAAFGSAKADVLVNLASLGFGHAPTIVSAAEEAGIERAIFVSTTAIFTNLNAPSKAVRVAAEDAIRSSNLRWTILRPTMIYGTPRDRNMWRLLRALRRTPLVPLPGAANLHQPIHVADLAGAVVTAAERGETAHNEYDLAGPEAITLRALVGDAASAVGRRVTLVPVPSTGIEVALKAIERFGRRQRISAEQVARLREDKAFDISAAQRDLDFDPRPFAQGIAEEAAMAS